MGLLLAPYNDSMRLGQGYNSFLQSPCMYNAVLVTQSNSQKTSASQTVSYSSHIVNRISDVTRSMGISTGSSIKQGSVALSGNAPSVDESKFIESHMNVIVSVKVVNETIEVDDETKFNSSLAAQVRKDDNAGFHELFGDCYISGYIYGGDLHGIVSIKVLDNTKKEEIRSRIIRDINCADACDFSFDPAETSGIFESHLSECETTVTVNWSGGGRIKPDNEEWSLESLYRVAASFPGKVAACPQKTWAILTPYRNNPDFLKWAAPRQIVPNDYTSVQAYASDLLDTYVAYKNDIRHVQSVLADPSKYELGLARNPISLLLESLLSARKDMKSEIGKIMEEVDRLNEDPGRLIEVMNSSLIQAPELWATRLPILKGIPSSLAAALRRFALLESDLISDSSRKKEGLLPEVGLGRPLGAPAKSLYRDTGAVGFSDHEREALEDELNRRILVRYRFDAAPSNLSGAENQPIAPSKLKDEIRMNAVFSAKYGWPSRVWLNLRTGFSFAFGRDCEFALEELPVENSEGSLALVLKPNERITCVQIGKRRQTDRGKQIISYLRLQYPGDSPFVGDEPGLKDEVETYNVPDGCEGLAFILPTARNDATGAVTRFLLVWK